MLGLLFTVPLVALGTTLLFFSLRAGPGLGASPHTAQQRQASVFDPITHEETAPAAVLEPGADADDPCERRRGRPGTARRSLVVGGLQVQRAGVDAVAQAAASRGPSSKTWPRWPPQRAQTTSVRLMPCDWSSRSSTASATAGSVKLGQPVPESNLVSESNSSAPQPAQR